MSNSIYATLSRQDGLLKELQVVANNIANTNTSGYKTDRALFAEYVMATGNDNPSLSMGGLAGHSFDMTQGTVKFTGGKFGRWVGGNILGNAGSSRAKRRGQNCANRRRICAQVGQNADAICTAGQQRHGFQYPGQTGKPSRHARPAERVARTFPQRTQEDY